MIIAPTPISGCCGYSRCMEIPPRQLRDRLPNLVVLAPEKKQRAAGVDHNVFNFSDEDRVVASVLRVLQMAFQVSQRAIQNRSTMPGAVEASTSPGLNALRICIVL